MNQLFIDKVKKIIEENISDESFGASELASSLNLSNSQTLRKVKAASGKSVNQFIRDTRIERAAKLLKESDLSISEIAFQVGFKSPSYFSRTFNSYYGASPLDYKSKDNTQDAHLESSSTPKKVFERKKIALLFSILLVSLIGYFVLNKSFTNKETFSNSIAVMPFKDLSPEDNQWFCDGVSDNILHSLAQMDEMTVTSFTSSATYRDSNKQITEIAEELNVSYILEGSVTLYNDQVKIIAQLINANDEHIWSKEYNENFDDIISIQNNVAEEVMKQLKITISPKDKIALKKHPTENMEAYSLYLKGQFFNQGRKTEDVHKSFEYNRRAIELDSNFADAYAQLADNNFFIATKWFHVNEPFHLNRAFNRINKALELDSNSLKANAVKARLTLGLNAAESETYFKKALSLNPNDAETRYWYSYFFTTKENPDLNQALEQAKKAHQISPFSRLTVWRYVWILLLNNKNDEANTVLNDYGFVLHKHRWLNLKIAVIVQKNKGIHELEPYLFEKIKEDPENKGYYYFWLSWVSENLFLDKDKTLNYGIKAMEKEPLYTYSVLNFMSNNGFYEEVEEIINSNAFKNHHGASQMKSQLEFYYYKKDYQQALKIIDEDTTSMLSYAHLSRTYAQMGDRKKLDSINKLYFIIGKTEYIDKAMVHAILTERDSMYYYLNKSKYNFQGFFGNILGLPELDPYRNEERFQDLLKEFYLINSAE